MSISVWSAAKKSHVQMTYEDSFNESPEYPHSFSEDIYNRDKLEILKAAKKTGFKPVYPDKNGNAMPSRGAYEFSR